jgi:hypothetical protein
MHALACQKCGAGLPPPDAYGNSWCSSCGAGHHSAPAADEIAAAILAQAMIGRMAEEAACIAMTDEAILGLLRRRFTASDSMYFAPTIPDKKERAVARAHAGGLPIGERILALYDDTVLGSGEDGFAVTAQRLCWKNAGEPAQQIEWAAVEPDDIQPEGGRLASGPGAIAIAGDAALIDACADAVYVLALSARHAQRPHPSAAPTTPPPPHAISYHAYAAHASSQSPPAYACWQCTTPHHWNTPRCARCGAWPSAEGWARTG